MEDYKKCCRNCWYLCFDKKELCYKCSCVDSEYCERKIEYEDLKTQTCDEWF